MLTAVHNRNDHRGIAPEAMPCLRLAGNSHLSRSLLRPDATVATRCGLIDAAKDHVPGCLDVPDARGAALVVLRLVLPG